MDGCMDGNKMGEKGGGGGLVCVFSQMEGSHRRVRYPFVLVRRSKEDQGSAAGLSGIGLGERDENDLLASCCPCLCPCCCCAGGGGDRGTSPGLGMVPEIASA